MILTSLNGYDKANMCFRRKSLKSTIIVTTTENYIFEVTNEQHLPSKKFFMQYGCTYKNK